MSRWLMLLFMALLGTAMMEEPALAQETFPDPSCHPESVVLTRCDAPPPAGGAEESAAARAAREEARKKAELAAALERQRQRNAAAARGASPDDLDRAEVTGQRLHTPSPTEVFNSYFGTPSILAPDITQSTDQMGNRTECITHCVGFGCCKTVMANPPSPGVINGNP